MPKQIQGLIKRTGPISYVRSGATLDDTGPIRIGEVFVVTHEHPVTGDRSLVRVRLHTPQEDGVLIGDIVGIDPYAQDGVSGCTVGNDIITHLDFVFVVDRQ